MNYVNFNRKYITDYIWSGSSTCVWEHMNGTVVQIEMYWEENYVFLSFENGPTLDIKLTGSVIKVGFHNEVRTRDLAYHPSWNTNRSLLIKLYLRHVLGQKTTAEQREAIWDIVSNEINF